MAQLAQQPSARRGPRALHRGWGHSQDLRGIFNRKSPEVAQFDDLALLPIQLRKTVESFVESEQIHVALWRSHTFVQSYSRQAGTALGRTPVSFIVHQNPAHQLSGDAEEVRAVLHLRRFLSGQPQVSLMDQGGGLQSVVRTLLAKIRPSEAPQLVV